MQQGTVKFFNDEKGYGFIAGDDGKDVFVHRTRLCMPGHRILDKSQRVAYDVETTDKGNMAINVVLI